MDENSYRHPLEIELGTTWLRRMKGEERQMWCWGKEAWVPDDTDPDLFGDVPRWTTYGETWCEPESNRRRSE
jgi:hypothetical protein